MSDDHTQRPTNPAQNDVTVPPTLKRLPLTFGITKGGQPKYPDPGKPGSLSHLIALRLAARGTRVRVVDLDPQPTGTFPRSADQ
ncbi:hypothetical protein AB0393_29040 [Streptomyces cyaneofuscatus]|uniref:hypothetical protein n=1 Tax=Streptomyces cyaneofuscatus TaxID=66883 RepID=UPI00344C1586